MLPLTQLSERVAVSVNGSTRFRQRPTTPRGSATRCSDSWCVGVPVGGNANTAGTCRAWRNSLNTRPDRLGAAFSHNSTRLAQPATTGPLSSPPVIPDVDVYARARRTTASRCVDAGAGRDQGTVSARPRLGLRSPARRQPSPPDSQACDAAAVATPTAAAVAGGPMFRANVCGRHCQRTWRPAKRAPSSCSPIRLHFSARTEPTQTSHSYERGLRIPKCPCPGLSDSLTKTEKVKRGVYSRTEARGSSASFTQTFFACRGSALPKRSPWPHGHHHAPELPRGTAHNRI